MIRFDPPALHAALAAERVTRSLSWEQGAARTGVAETTIRRTRGQGRFEVDGALALARWVGRPLEHFTVESPA